MNRHTQIRQVVLARLREQCGDSATFFDGLPAFVDAQELAQVVGSGAFRGNDIGMVARAAAQMERSVGQSVSDTINQFKRLKDDPVNAAKALDNELHFLTATQLEQIWLTAVCRLSPGIISA